MPILQAGLGHGLMPILPKHSLTLPCSALDNQFRMSILERLEQMERRMAEMTGSQQHKQGSGGGSSGGGTGSGSGGSQAQVRVPGTIASLTPRVSLRSEAADHKSLSSAGVLPG